MPDTKAPNSATEQPRLWNVREPYQYAPPKPKDDPWTTLVEPLLRKDKMQCDVWKDEVQNLLIFAGLFSAIVTALIVESYKSLQPDPNDAIISLLSRIALRLDGPINATAGLYSSPAQIFFTPAPSAIRVNTFWFLSLVLSLTSVLAGIISLQWLREHLVYADLSPREKYATYYMRADALKKWHVDKIFTAMPLLLQCALVLFLAGIVDFLHSLGFRQVTVPATVVVGLTLLFLVATTLLPSLQILSLYTHFPGRQGRPSRPISSPSKCPYKSPQSRAVLVLVRLVSSFCCRLYSHILNLIEKLGKCLNLPKSNSDPVWQPKDKFTRYLHQALHASPRWIDFDEAWLNIRDAYMRRAVGKEPFFREPTLGRQYPQLPPIYDIVGGLQAQSWQKASAVSSHHCFVEISELENIYDRLHQEEYLYELLTNDECLKSDLSLCRWLTGDTSGILDRSTLGSDILRQQNTFLYLRSSSTYYPEVELLSTHRVEIGIRLMIYFYLEKRAIASVHAADLNSPSCLSVDSLNILNPIFRDPQNYDFIWQIVNFALALLIQLEEGYRDDVDPPLNIKTQQSHFIALIPVIAHLVYMTSMQTHEHSIHSTASERLSATRSLLDAIPAHLERRLSQELSETQTARHAPSVFFYISAQYCSKATPEQVSHYASLCSTLLQYKRVTVDVNQLNQEMETTHEKINAGSDSLLKDVKSFSEDIWEYLGTISGPT
uniref:DUF6535 domain-containing protein n=1 Tax=Psilocybe cubensis TaxID=181762 RepID=A0A8H7XNM2_PSICU